MKVSELCRARESERLIKAPIAAVQDRCYVTHVALERRPQPAYLRTSPGTEPTSDYSLVRSIKVRLMKWPSPLFCGSIRGRELYGWV